MKRTSFDETTFAYRILASLGLLAAACGDDTSQTDGTGTDTNTNVTGISQTGPMDDSTTGTPDDDTTGTTVVLDDTGPPVPTCETIFCGTDDPPACCAEGEECILAQCLPACETNVRCGVDLATCCEAGQVCLQPECVTPGAPCIDSYDCPEGEFCEPTAVSPDAKEGQTGACLPNPDEISCELQPEFTELLPVEEWANTDDDIISIPVVGDVDGDGLPEVVINTYDAGGVDFFSEIVVLDGTNGQEQTRIVDDPDGPNDDGMNPSFGSYARSTIGLADVDGNGLPDIVYVGRPMAGAPFPADSSHIHAVNGLGQLLWTSHDAVGNPHRLYVRQGAPSFANFDDDDASEIVYGASVLDNDGLVVFDPPHPSGLGGAVFGSNGVQFQSGRGGISAIVDLTGDNYPEIVSGADAWTVDWDDPGVGTPTVTLTQMWTNTDGTDGYPAIADLDSDGDPEVVLVAEGTLRVLDGATGELWCGIDPTGAMCALNDALRTQPIVLAGADAGRGGPPTIGDFDGDGRPELGVAGATSYAVYDLYRAGEEVVQPAGDPPAALGEAYVRWWIVTDDQSGATGSSVFDFQGDGPAEVVYGDECYVRVLDGSDGSILLEIENQNDTIREYPIVVDVDGDNNSELVVVANDVAATADQCAMIPGYTPRQGIYVYGDSLDQWVRTRQVWTQHTYHVTNSGSTGLTPAIEDANWLQPELNNYRQNVQGEGAFNAPDLQVDLAVGTGTCLDEMFEIVATVRNVGSIGVPEGIDVSLYSGTDASGTLVSTQQTPTPLLPGGSVDVLWQVPAPGGTPLDFFVLVDNDDGDPLAGAVAECVEDNNTSSTTSVSCPIPG
jgi:hypothetical protein